MEKAGCIRYSKYNASIEHRTPTYEKKSTASGCSEVMFLESEVWLIGDAYTILAIGQLNGCEIERMGVLPPNSPANRPRLIVMPHVGKRLT